MRRIHSTFTRRSALPLSASSLQQQLKGLAFNVAPPPPPSTPSRVLQNRPGGQPTTPPNKPRQQTSSTTIVSDKIFTADSLLDFVPSFFIPVEEALQNMPGYTLEHLKRFFGQTKGFQIVQLPDPPKRTFVRLHGFLGFPDLSSSTVSSQWLHYFPDPALVVPIVEKAFVAEKAKFMKNPGEAPIFVPLTTVLQRLGKEMEDKLPFRGPEAILFFAQMQHMFLFRPAASGGLVAFCDRQVYNAWAPRHGKAPMALTPDSTPCPVAFNEAYLSMCYGSRSLDQLTDTLTTKGLMPHLTKIYPSVKEFLLAHSRFIHFDEKTDVAMNQKQYELEQRRQLPVSEQLKTLTDKQTKDARRLRRKELDKDNPYLNTDVLADALIKFLPRTGHLALGDLTRKLPQEIFHAMPVRTTRFFKRYSNHFSLFEYRYPNNWYVQRAGLPLPPGAISDSAPELSEDQLMKEVVSRGFSNTSRSNTNVNFLGSKLPSPVRDQLRRQYGGIGSFFLRFPEYFAVALPKSPMFGALDDATLSNEPNTIVTLLKPPPCMTIREGSAPSTPAPAVPIRPQSASNNTGSLAVPRPPR